MRTVKLYAAVPFVAANFVVELQIPPFQYGPDVLIWGSRTFKQMAQPDEYLECFAFVVPIIKEPQ